MQDNHKIKKLVGDSFLSPEQKRFLLQYIDLKGIDMRFADIFKDYLIESIRERGEEYEESVKKIEKADMELEERITLEKSRIEERLTQELTGLDPLDLKTKTRIWEEYYDTLDELGQKYEKKLKELLSKIEIPSIA